MTTNRNFVVLGDDGEPIGMLDAQQIDHDSTMLAVALAAATSDPINAPNWWWKCRT